MCEEPPSLLTWGNLFLPSPPPVPQFASPTWYNYVFFFFSVFPCLQENTPPPFIAYCCSLGDKLRQLFLIDSNLFPRGSTFCIQSLIGSLFLFLSQGKMILLYQFKTLIVFKRCTRIKQMSIWGECFIYYTLLPHSWHRINRQLCVLLALSLWLRSLATLIHSPVFSSTSLILQGSRGTHIDVRGK